MTYEVEVAEGKTTQAAKPTLLARSKMHAECLCDRDKLVGPGKTKWWGRRDNHERGGSWSYSRHLVLPKMS